MPIFRFLIGRTKTIIQSSSAMKNGHPFDAFLLDESDSRFFFGLSDFSIFIWYSISILCHAEIECTLYSFCNTWLEDPSFFFRMFHILYCTLGNNNINETKRVAKGCLQKVSFRDLILPCEISAIEYLDGGSGCSCGEIPHGSRTPCQICSREKRRLLIKRRNRKILASSFLCRRRKDESGSREPDRSHRILYMQIYY
jgi:hypothetical protein